MCESVTAQQLMLLINPSRTFIPVKVQQFFEQIRPVTHQLTLHTIDEQLCVLCIRSQRGFLRIQL